MNSPNILQKLYLARALNEDMTKIFEHPEQFDESYTERKQYGRKPPTPEQAAARKEAAAKWVEGRKKTHNLVKSPSGKKKIWVPKDQTNEETLAEGRHKKAMRAAGTPGFWGRENRATASELRRGGASPRTIKKYFNTNDYAAGSRAMAKFDREARAKREAGMLISLGATGAGGTARIASHATKMDAKRKKSKFPKLLPRLATMDADLAEGSRGTARLGRMMKSLIRNRQQADKIIGQKPKDFATRLLVSPNDPEVKAYKERLSAGVAHLRKKDELRRQINPRTRAAAMRERGRAGLHPALPSGASLSPAAPSPANQGKRINVTGGYEHQENPKRIPNAIKKYRQASMRKRMFKGSNP